jgi:hypothetical protein
VGTGTKENESSHGRVWAAGFHYVTARSRLARVLKIGNPLFLSFSYVYFSAAVKCVSRDTAVLKKSLKRLYYVRRKKFKLEVLDRLKPSEVRNIWNYIAF